MFEVDSGHIDSVSVDALRSRVGESLRIRPLNSEVSVDGLRRFASGIGDVNPLWLDASYGDRSYYGTRIAPPTYVSSIAMPTGGLAGGLPGVQSTLVNQAFTFLRPLRMGEALSAEAKLSKVEYTKSDDGDIELFQTVSAQYATGHDEVVCEASGTSVRRERKSIDAAVASVRGLAQDVDFGALEDQQMDKTRQGDSLLYFNDVFEGQVLPELVKGPLSFGDVQAYIAGTIGSRALVELARYGKRHPAGTYIDESGYRQPLLNATLDDNVAKAIGFPRAFGFGSQKVCWLTQMLTDWMGDAGRLTRINVDLLGPTYHGDLTWCRGAIVAKHFDESGRNEIPVGQVECALYCENHRGEITARGTAWVRLLTRDVRRWGRLGEGFGERQL